MKSLLTVLLTLAFLSACSSLPSREQRQALIDDARDTVEELRGALTDAEEGLDDLEAMDEI